MRDIADDRAALLGSANINDRSLLGGRDSELAAIITDNAQLKVKLDGVHPVDVSAAIHKLRRALWEKHFGLKSANRKAAALAGTDILDSPAAPATWKAIQKVAFNNARAYETAFWFIPRSGARPEVQTKDTVRDKEPGPPPASLWPTWHYTDYLDHKQGGRLLYRMPFDPLFWRAAERDLSGLPEAIKGDTKEIAEIEASIANLERDWQPMDLGLPDSLGYVAGPTFYAFLLRNGRAYQFMASRADGDPPHEVRKVAFFKLLKNFRTRALYEVPTEPGVCIPYRSP